jgi:hypothetical protein
VQLSGKVQVKGGGAAKRGKLSIKLKSVTLALNAGATATKKLKPKKGKKAVRRVNALLEDGAQAKVSLRGVATNEAGTGEAKRKVKLRAR